MQILQLPDEEWRERGVKCGDEIRTLALVDALVIARGITVVAS